MEYNDFIKLTEKQKPSEKLSGIHLAIWYIFRDNWDLAHETVQKLKTEIACRFHAYLHRLEGDLGHATGIAGRIWNQLPLHWKRSSVIL